MAGIIPLEGMSRNILVGPVCSATWGPFSGCWKRQDGGGGPPKIFRLQLSFQTSSVHSGVGSSSYREDQLLTVRRAEFEIRAATDPNAYDLRGGDLHLFVDVCTYCTLRVHG